VNYYRHLLFACIWSFLICSGSDEEIFLRANKYCKQHDWNQALALYKSINQKGSLVWYNMGNCCYHLKNYTEALIYWKRAEQSGSYIIYAQSKHNQHILARQLNRVVPVIWIQRLYEFFVYNLLGVSLLFLQVLFLFLWFFFFFLKRYWSETFFSAALVMVMLSGLIGTGIAVKYKQMNKIGIIITDGTKIFAGPSQEYHVLDVLNHIDQVTIQDVKPDWYKVKYATGVGWAVADAVQVV